MRRQFFFAVQTATLHVLRRAKAAKERSGASEEDSGEEAAPGGHQAHAGAHGASSAHQHGECFIQVSQHDALALSVAALKNVSNCTSGSSNEVLAMRMCIDDDGYAADCAVNMLMISSSDSENRVAELEAKNQWLPRGTLSCLVSHWVLPSSSCTRFSLSDEEIMSMLSCPSAPHDALKKVANCNSARMRIDDDCCADCGDGDDDDDDNRYVMVMVMVMVMVTMVMVMVMVMSMAMVMAMVTLMAMMMMMMMMMVMMMMMMVMMMMMMMMMMMSMAMVMVVVVVMVMVMMMMMMTLLALIVILTRSLACRLLTWGHQAAARADRRPRSPQMQSSRRQSLRPRR